MRRTPSISLTLSVVGVVVLSACSSSGESEATSDTVIFWDTSGAGENPVFREVAEGCAESGGYTVDVQTVAFDQARNNFKTAAQGGQGPDVMRAEVAWVAEFADAGLLVDLSDTSLAEDTSDFLEVPLESGTFDGKTYGIPQVTDTLALYYNRQMLEQAGVDPPQTWEEVGAVAAALGGGSALFMNNNGYFALPFIYGAGGDLVDTDAQEIVVNSAEAVAGLQAAKDLLDAGAAQTALDPTNSYESMSAAFTTGQVAMIMNGPWAVVDILKGEAFLDPANLGIAPVPGVTPGSGSAPIGGHDYVIRQGTGVQESAIAFVECMAGTESQVQISAELGLLPTRQSAYEDTAVSTQPTVAGFADVITTAHARAWIPEAGELFEPLNTAYADVLAGNTDAQSALDAVASAYQEILPEYSTG